jgi:hypothetical protein
MGVVTEPSLHHSKALKLILYLLRDPDNRGQTLVETFDDIYPFNQLEKKIIPFNTYRGTFSVDRRSIEE